MQRIAILIDLEFTEKSGGHVKFWQRIYESIKNEKLNYKLEFFFLGKANKTKIINNFISLNFIKPVISSKILKPIGIDADTTDLAPINPLLFRRLKKFDLIHTTDQLFTMAKTAKKVSRKFKIPLTTSFHTDTPSYSEFYVKKILNYFPRLISNFMISKLKLHKSVKYKQEIKIVDFFKYCKKVMINKSISFSSYSKDYDSKKIIYLERGVDKKIFKKRKVDKKKFLKRYNLSVNSKIIFFCGRIHELKGALFLAKIHNSLQSKGHNVSTFLAGENLQGDKCKKIGGKNLFILDYLSEKEISIMMNLSDFFIFPSLYETGPQVILEAKACESVCIVSPGGGGREIKKNGEDGVVIDKYDVDTWCKKIANLMSNTKTSNLIKKKLKNDNSQKSWKDIYFLQFDSKWKDLLKA